MEIPEKIKKIVDGHGWIRHLTVGDIMEPNVVTINEDATLKQLDSLIREYKHLGYPVVNNENKTTGVISYKDLLRVKKDGNVTLLSYFCCRLGYVLYTDTFSVMR